MEILRREGVGENAQMRPHKARGAPSKHAARIFRALADILRAGYTVY
jgi:hypothetical protein